MTNKYDKKSDLEEALATQMKQVGLPAPVRQFKAIPGREFKFDFCYPEKKLLIEVQGAIWAGRRGEQSGHSSGVGIMRDHEKNNLAVINGYRVLYVNGNTIRSGEAVTEIETALNNNG